MKRFLITFLITLLLMQANVFAAISPHYVSDLKYSGIGIINMPQRFNLYMEPDKTAKIIERVDLSTPVDNFSSIDKKDFADNFLVYDSEKKFAYLPVYDERDGWYEVFTSQQTGSTAWVYYPEGKFFTWREFFNLHGRKNGLYFFKDAPSASKVLLAQPEKNAKKVEGFTYPKRMHLTLIKGNWMLVKVLDLNNSEKYGYIQWRNIDGEFFVFPKLDDAHYF